MNPMPMHDPAGLPRVTQPSIFPYPIVCEGGRCGRPAVFKVASRWSDDFTWEWKTYGLVCRDCLNAMYESALLRQKACANTAGESLGVPVVLELAPGQTSQQMVRRAELEQPFTSSRDSFEPKFETEFEPKDSGA